ncbi:hypothetical protein PPO43_00495 [Saprospira sp. CCB-QB6]|uniref:hypothetical protein n=1 Tax=Saprospira sp. CCB-QB6 TaxID=3023936 RepID=UPI002349767B|nr:hypothetical protein [Saprospira sp. CCB-QB6]WCL81575.1 hypothetical protein PPO43_00495 [Saprospira sp. CCB-QB6]
MKKISYSILCFWVLLSCQFSETPTQEGPSEEVLAEKPAEDLPPKSNCVCNDRILDADSCDLLFQNILGHYKGVKMEKIGSVKWGRNHLGNTSIEVAEAEKDKALIIERDRYIYGEDTFSLKKVDLSRWRLTTFLGTGTSGVFPVDTSRFKWRDSVDYYVLTLEEDPPNFYNIMVINGRYYIFPIEDYFMELEREEQFEYTHFVEKKPSPIREEEANTVPTDSAKGLLNDLIGIYKQGEGLRLGSLRWGADYLGRSTKEDLRKAQSKRYEIKKGQLIYGKDTVLYERAVCWQEPLYAFLETAKEGVFPLDSSKFDFSGYDTVTVYNFRKLTAVSKGVDKELFPNRMMSIQGKMYLWILDDYWTEVEK